MLGMTLSEAIRLGAILRPQAFTAFSDSGSCALRAAAEAIGFGFLGEIPYLDLMARFPVLTIESRCPVCHRITSGDCKIVWHLNDHHEWTREQIADFIEQIENQLSLKTIEEHSDLAVDAVPQNR